MRKQTTHGLLAALAALLLAGCGTGGTTAAALDIWLEQGRAADIR